MTKNTDVYKNFTPYTSQPVVERPLLDEIDKSTLVAFFRCNSCYTCKWREEIIDRDPDERHDIHWCSKLHDRVNLIDMVSYLGYSKEGRESDSWPRWEGDYEV